MSRESTTTITDKLIEPFFLTKDEYCYTLIEKVYQMVVRQGDWKLIRRIEDDE